MIIGEYVYLGFLNHKTTLKKYKINDNPNTFILLRLYFHNQLNKTK